MKFETPFLNMSAKGQAERWHLPGTSCTVVPESAAKRAETVVFAVEAGTVFAQNHEENQKNNQGKESQQNHETHRRKKKEWIELPNNNINVHVCWPALATGGE